MSFEIKSCQSSYFIVFCLFVFCLTKNSAQSQHISKPSLKVNQTSGTIGVVSIDTIYKNFIDPPLVFKPRPLWFWNKTTVTSNGITEQMQNCRDNSGYGGFGIVPFGIGFGPTYLGEGYFNMYGAALQKARELGMKLRIYDEYGFPSGSAGAQNGDGIARFKNKYPDATIKRLDKIEEIIIGPKAYFKTLSAGELMSVVAMDTISKKMVDITDKVTNSTINWNAPAGIWRVMTFLCVRTTDAVVDYLDPDAVDKFIGMVHQAYYDRFKDYFGNTIDGIFYDEPTLYRSNGRVWTPKFNEKFQALYGFSPTLYYPALWYDIGPETQAARNTLFGFRTELYATGFMKRSQDWCTTHGGITATGHQDNEDNRNPVGTSGDIMKCYKYQDIPGIDKISGGANRPAEKYYKLVSSSAYNWDKPLIMSETYGDMGNISWDQIYSVAMEQYTKGINMLIPHAVWYDNSNVTFLPELSYRNPLYSAGLPNYTKFIGRLNVMLQNEGRHVADIAVLYPIATLQGDHYMDGPLGAYAGGVTMPEDDYADLGEMLSTDVCRDFTWIHPEILEERCTIEGNRLKLNNTTNFEEYKVLVVPGHKTIRWNSLQKIKQFYDNGGKVIFTGTLPTKSAEFGQDSAVVAIIAEMLPGKGFGVSTTTSSQWSTGGYNANKATDGLKDTRWNAASGSPANQWLQVDFGRKVSFNKTIISESYNRITSYNIQYWNDNAWVNCAAGTTIGTLKTDSFAVVNTSRVRLFINAVNSTDSPSIFEFEVHLNNGVNLANYDSLNVNRNDEGGRALYIKTAKAELLRNALDSLENSFDVKIDKGIKLRYIHKIRDNRDIYYFANTSATSSVGTYVKIKGKITPEILNPHNGKITKAIYSYITENGEDYTRIRIVISPSQSCFVLSPSNYLSTVVSNTIQNDLKIYPNPIDNLLTVELDDKLYRKLEIVDMCGRVVMICPIASGLQFMKVDVSGLKQGVYSVSLLGGNCKMGKLVLKK